MGCGRLGVCYATGTGIPQDLAEGARYYNLGCEGKDSLSCGKLGLLYEAGTGVGKDFDPSLAGSP